LKEVRISRKNILLIVTILVVTVAGLLAIHWFSQRQPASQPTPSPEQGQITSAITAGVEAFFKIDYHEGKAVWLERICAASTENGCKYFQSGSDALWKRFTDFQIVTQGKAQLLDLVRATDKELVWHVSIQLTQPLPGSEKTRDEAYVLVVRTPAGWRFERFLLEPEIQALKKSATQEPTK
jgi:hypothetical protein